MKDRAQSYGALARALAPPGGDASAFPVLGLPTPGATPLESEHVALFGRAGRGVLSPYEGVHRGTGLHEILAACAAAGFAPDPSFHDRPDHVSAELALLEGLARREERALCRGDGETARIAAEQGRAFFLGHVWPWVPAFFDSIARAAGFPLHRALAAYATVLMRREGGRASAPRAGPRPAKAPPAEPPCSTCGAPLGFRPPEREDTHAAPGYVCLRCRVRLDLRRLEL